MPELPEVETVRRGLETALKNATISKVTLRRAGLRIPFPDAMADRLAGRNIQAIGRRAKYLLFAFDREEVLIAHLGMTGRFSVLPVRPEAWAAHDHCIFDLADDRCVIFNDARRFGLMTLCKSSALETHSLLAHLGPEPLEEAFSSAYLKSALAGRQAPIKTVLMDQSVVVGVGNIYASEALYLARIHPRIPASEAASKAGKLVASIRQVLEEALASGGSSLRDFHHVSGESGYFQHHFNVYGRKAEPCFICRNPIETLRQAGRSTFFCSQCQA